MSATVREEGLWISTGNPFTVNEASPPFAPGQLGKVSSFRNASAENGVATAPAPIDVQFVLRYATDTVAAVVGSPAFWQDADNFVVTSECASAIGGTTAPLLAGVFGGSYPAASSYGFIQVGGVGPVRILDSTSSSTVGVPLVWSTNQLLRQATAQDSNRQVMGIVKTLTALTTTTLSVEAVIAPSRIAW